MEKKLNFTDQALNQINLITKGDENKYFRIIVQGGGCSGFKYSFGFDSKLNGDDIVFGKTVIEMIRITIIIIINKHSSTERSFLIVLKNHIKTYGF